MLFYVDMFKKYLAWRMECNSKFLVYLILYLYSPFKKKKKKRLRLRTAGIFVVKSCFYPDFVLQAPGRSLAQGAMATKVVSEFEYQVSLFLASFHVKLVFGLQKRQVKKNFFFFF